MAEIKSIGILETKGLVPLIAGADAAVKAANVDIVEWRQVGSGYVSFVADAAITAASAAGEVISHVVIPRPVAELGTTFGK
jgi:ethanolamine utilization protein EutM